jgi:hypothetical protein
MALGNKAKTTPELATLGQLEEELRRFSDKSNLTSASLANPQSSTSMISIQKSKLISESKTLQATRRTCSLLASLRLSTKSEFVIQIR